MEITPSSVVVATPDHMSTQLGDETVILHMGVGVYFGLDPVGTRVWSLIQKPRRVEHICASLLEVFEVDAGRCQRSVLALLAEMANAGLIEIAREPAP